MLHLALIANPVAHSKSPLMQNAAMKALGIDGVYTRYLLDSADEFKDKFFALGLDGANVSLPYKSTALQYANIASSAASAISSANTILRDKHDKSILRAYNTDFVGFLCSLGSLASKCQSAIILGAGGTTKALAYALNLANISTTIANRSPERFVDFADFECLEYERISASYDIVINATSASLQGALPCDQSVLDRLFARAVCAYDVGYFDSLFLQRFAHTRAADIASGRAFAIDGAWMLAYQGACSLMYFAGMARGDEIDYLKDSKLRQQSSQIAKIMYNIAFL